MRERVPLTGPFPWEELSMLSQILAVVIFVVMFVEIVREKFPRYLVALVAGALTVVVVFLEEMQSDPAVLEA